MEGGQGLIVGGPSYYSGFLADHKLKATHQRVAQANSDPHSYLRSTGARFELTYAPTIASAQFRQDAVKYLRALAKHIQAQPYDGAVAGIHLCYGWDMQWNWPIYTGPGEFVGDYSLAMLNRFRASLREKYKTDAALRTAWQDPGVTLDTAQIPAQARRERGRAFLDPATDRAVIDYNTIQALCPAEALMMFGRALKESFSRKILVGAYYNDISILAAGGPSAGHGGQRELLASKDVDLFTGVDYEARGLGMPGGFTYMTDSWRLHNKLIVTELDHRLFTVLNRWYTGNEVFNTAFKSVSVLQREFMAMICRGVGGWNLDMAGGTMDSPLLLDTWQQMFRIYQDALTHDRSSVARLAVFAGYEAKSYQGTLFRGRYPQALIQSQRSAWKQAGVPVDQYLLPDIVQLKRDYDVYVFMMAGYVSPPEQAAIEALKRNNKILVFCNAAGLLTESGISTKAMSDLVGMEISLTDQPLTHALIRDPRDPITAGLPAHLGDHEYEREVQTPFFHVIDPAARSLAQYENGRVAWAAKTHKKWTSVFIGPVGLIPSGFYRNLARIQAAPIYCETDDSLYVCKDYVGIHAATKGIKRLCFPEAFRVREMLLGKDYGLCREVWLNMDIGENAFFELEGKARAMQ
jgi:hypothetical protein